MTDSDHYRALERMYLAAPINRIFNPRIKVSQETAEIEMEIRDQFFHAAGAVHGAVYFKMLDDAAFFAANSLVTDYFVLTRSFTTHFLRPVSKGIMKATGHVLKNEGLRIHAESAVYNTDGKIVGQGTGVFVRSRMLIENALGYRRQ